MEQKEEEPPLFWVQNTAALRRADRRRRGQNQASSLFLNTGVLVVLLLAAAVVFLAIVIPSVLSLARQVFNPSLVKSSWNSLNLILVLFAIVCGFLGKRDDDQTPVSSPMRRDSGKSAESSPSPRQWYGYHQQSRMEYNSFGNVDTMRSLRRYRNSYPDLRQDGTWTVNENRWRFYDDTHVDNYQVQRSDSGNCRISRSRSMGVLDEDDIDIKNIEVDSFVSGAKEVAPPSPSPPAQPAARKSHYRSRSREEADEKDQYVTKNIEMDTSVSYQAKYQRHESNPSMVNKPVPPSQPSYSQQPFSPPSPQSPINYFWPSPSPPPPPPPPPPQRAYSSVPAKKKHGNKRNKDKQAQSESKSMNEIQMSPPPPPSPPPSYFMHQPLTPPSPPSPNHYFWPPPSPPPPPPPPPPPRTHSSNIAKKKHENKRNTPSKTESRSKAQTQIPTPPPPPPQLRPILGNISEHKTNTSEDTREKKKGIVIRTLNRFPRRRKRQSRRSYENLSEFIEPPKASIHRSKSTPEFPPSSPPPPAPPPPPPPPPPSMFHNMFSKKGKTKKKEHSTSTSSPPSPPPLPARPLPKTRIKPPSTRRPAPPTKTDSFSSVDDNIGNGSESPLIPIPPPPPPPPFKMSSWKYIMQGDYVKIVSNNNSPRSGYSASEDEGNSPSNHKTSMPSRLSCPSPDVNTKADDFIARFRAKLTLEKMNSIKRNNSSDPSPLGSESGQP